MGFIVTHDAKIGVHATQKSRLLSLAWLMLLHHRIMLLNRRIKITLGPILDINTIRLDDCTQKLDAF